MAIPDPPKAGSPFPPLQTGGWNPKTPEINNFFIPLFSFLRGYTPRRDRRFWAVSRRVWGRFGSFLFLSVPR